MTLSISIQDAHSLKDETVCFLHHAKSYDVDVVGAVVVMVTESDDGVGEKEAVCSD